MEKKWVPQQAYVSEDEFVELDPERSKPWLIKYSDMRRRKTERLITPTKLEGDIISGGNEIVVRYVHAFCHLRQAERSFAFFEIKEIADPETGEILSHRQWLRSLPIILRELPAPDPEPPTATELQSLFDQPRRQESYFPLVVAALVIIGLFLALRMSSI